MKLIKGEIFGAFLVSSVLIFYDLCANVIVQKMYP